MKKSERKGDWLTIRAIAGVFGITSQGFRSSYLSELAPVDVRQGSKGVATTIYAPAAVELFAQRRVQEALRQSVANEIENGPPSKELEKLRRVKRQREEFAFAKEINEIDSRGVVWGEITEAMAHIRRFAEEEIKKHGTATADAWIETVEEVDRIATRYVPPSARSRTLRIQLDDGTDLDVPLPLFEGLKK